MMRHNRLLPANVGAISFGTIKQPGFPKPQQPTHKIAKMILRFLQHPATYEPNKNIENPKLAKKKKK